MGTRASATGGGAFAMGKAGAAAGSAGAPTTGAAICAGTPASGALGSWTLLFLGMVLRCDSGDAGMAEARRRAWDGVSVGNSSGRGAVRVGGPARGPVGLCECRREGGSCERKEGDWEVAFGGRWCSEELAVGLRSCRTAPAGTAERARAAEAMPAAMAAASLGEGCLEA